MFRSPSISSQTTHLLRHCSRELPHLRLSPIRSFVSASGAGHKSNPSRRQSRLISYKMADSQDATQKDFLQRPPYQAADPAAFDKKLQGSCHCGRVKYWLSREQPLNAKFCHCRGCQVLHGKLTKICLIYIYIYTNPFNCLRLTQFIIIRFAVPMGCHIPQGRHDV